MLRPLVRRRPGLPPDLVDRRLRVLLLGQRQFRSSSSSSSSSLPSSISGSSKRRLPFKPAIRRGKEGESSELDWRPLPFVPGIARPDFPSAAAPLSSPASSSSSRVRQVPLSEARGESLKRNGAAPTPELQSFPSSPPSPSVAAPFTTTSNSSSDGNRFLPRKGGRVDALRELGKQNRSRESVALIEQFIAVPGQTLRRLAYHVALTTCRRARDGDSALQILQLMQGQRHALDHMAYNLAIGACARGGQLAAAERLWQEMTTAGYSGDAVAYKDMFKAYHAGKQGRAALKLLKQMEEQTNGGVGRSEAAARSSDSNLPPPDETMYAEVLGALGCEGRLNDASALLRRVEKEGRVAISPTMVSHLITGLATTKTTSSGSNNQGGSVDWRKAWKGWQVFKPYTNTLNPLAFHSLARCLSFGKQHRLVIDLCQGLRQQRSKEEGPLPLHPAILTAGLRAAARLQDHTQVLGFGREILAQGGVLTGANLRFSLGAALRLKDTALVDQLMKASLGVRPALKRNMLLGAYFELGQWEKMKTIFSSSPSSTAAVAGAEKDTPLQNNDTRREETMLDGGIKKEDFEYAYEDHRLMAMGAARFGYVEEAGRYLSEIERQGWEKQMQKSNRGTVVKKYMPGAHAAVALEWVRRKDWRRGLEVLRRMELVHGLEGRVALPYERVMDAAAKEGEVDVVLRLLSELKEQGLTISPMGYNAALYGCAMQNRLPDARAVFHEMLHGQAPSPTLINYNTMLLALARQGGFEEAKDLLIGMWKNHHVHPDIVSYNTVLAAGAKVGDWKGTLAFLRSMEQGHDMDDDGDDKARRAIPPDTVSYNTAMSAFQKTWRGGEDNWQKALQLMDEMRAKGVTPDASTFNTIIDVCCKAGQMDEALALLPVMRKEGHNPDCLTYNCLAYGYIQERRYVDALKVIEEMRREDVKFDEHTYEVSFRALAGLGRDREVECLFWDLQRKNMRSANGHKKQQQQRNTAFDMLLAGMVAVGRAADGVQMISRLEGQGKSSQDVNLHPPTVETFNIALTVCKSISSLDDALLLFTEAERRGLTLTREIYEALLKLCIVQKEWEKGIELLEMLRRTPGCKMDRSLYNCWLSYLSHLGDAQGSRKVLQEMRREGIEPDDVSYSWALRNEIKQSNNARGIKEVLAQAQEGGLPVDQNLAQIQVSALKKLGDWRGATLLLDRLVHQRQRAAAAAAQDRAWKKKRRRQTERKEGEVRVTTVMFNNALAALAQADQWDRSVDMIGGMKSHYGVEPDSVTYHYLITALGHLGKWEKALEVFEQVRSGVFGKHIVIQEQTYTTLMSICARGGRLEQTMQLYKLREASGMAHNRFSMNTIITAHVRAGQLDKAIEIFNGLSAKPGCEPDIVTYNALIDGHRLHETPLEIGGLLLHRRLLATPGLVPDAWTYTSLIASCSLSDMWPIALYLYDEAQLVLDTKNDASIGPSRKRDNEVTRHRPLLNATLLSPATSTSTEEGKYEHFQVLKVAISALDSMQACDFASQIYSEAFYKGYVTHWVDVPGGLVVDLHNFSRPMAKAALKCVLEELVAGYSPRSLVPPLYIIVGQGHKSAGGEAVLKQEVMTFFGNLNYPLHVEVHGKNPGRLVVSSTHLGAYLNAHLPR